MAQTKLATLENDLSQLQKELVNLNRKLEQFLHSHDTINVKVEGLTKNIEKVELRIEKINEAIEAMKNGMKHEYINNDKFEPVKLLVYGLVSIMLSAVVIGVLSVVVTTR